MPHGPQSEPTGQKKKKKKTASTDNKAIKPQHATMTPSMGGLMSNFLFVLCLSLIRVDGCVSALLTQVWS